MNDFAGFFRGAWLVLCKRYRQHIIRKPLPPSLPQCFFGYLRLLLLRLIFANRRKIKHQSMYETSSRKGGVKRSTMYMQKGHSPGTIYVSTKGCPRSSLSDLLFASCSTQLALSRPLKCLLRRNRELLAERPMKIDRLVGGWLVMVHWLVSTRCNVY